MKCVFIVLQEDENSSWNACFKIVKVFNRKELAEQFINNRPEYFIRCYKVFDSNVG